MSRKRWLLSVLSLGLGSCAPLLQPPANTPPPVFSPAPSSATAVPSPSSAPLYPKTAGSSAPVSAWRLASSPSLESLGGGAGTRFQARASDGRETVEIHAVIADSRYAHLRVIDQPRSNAGGGAISTAMRSAGAIAGVNGGFFTPEFLPLGRMIAQGAGTGAISQAKLLSGMFLVAGGQPYLIWRDEYAGDAGVSDLIQSGPRLVSAGMPLGGLDRGKSRPRTFIATDGGSKWIIGVVRSTSLAALAEMLATPGLFPGLSIRRALNLDGGNSSAIWMATPGGREISEPGWSTVRNFIAILPR